MSEEIRTSQMDNLAKTEIVESLEYYVEILKFEPRRIITLGTGTSSELLAIRYVFPAAEIVAFELNPNKSLVETARSIGTQLVREDLTEYYVDLDYGDLVICRNPPISIRTRALDNYLRVNVKWVKTLTDISIRLRSIRASAIYTFNLSDERESVHRCLDKAGISHMMRTYNIQEGVMINNTEVAKRDGFGIIV